MMQLSDLSPGDIVFSAKTLYSDGLVPGYPEGSVIVEEGVRGVLINTGHLEEDASQTIYLVRFENISHELGPALGCLADELYTGSGEK